MFREGKKRYCFFREHPAYSNLKMYSVLILFLFFWFPTIHPKRFCKSHFFLKFQVLHERSSVIASFMEHPICSNFKMYGELILFFYFDFTLFTQNASVKVIYSWNFKCSPKEAVILLLSWSSLYIAAWNSICPNSSFIYFVFSRLNQSECVKVFFSESSKCSAKGAVILHFSKSTLYIAFSKCIASWF